MLISSAIKYVNVGVHKGKYVNVGVHKGRGWGDEIRFSEPSGKGTELLCRRQAGLSSCGKIHVDKFMPSLCLLLAKLT